MNLIHIVVKTTLFITLLAFSIGGFAQSSTQFYFEPLTSEEAFDKARNEGKLVFIHISQKEKINFEIELFKDEKLAKFMSENYICIHLNEQAESAQFQLNNYGLNKCVAQSLFYNSNGDLGDQLEGVEHLNKGLFERRALRNIDPAQSERVVLYQKHEEGATDKETLGRLLEIMFEDGEDGSFVSRTYLENHQTLDLVNNKFDLFAVYFSSNNPGNEFVQLFVDHVEAIDAVQHEICLQKFGLILEKVIQIAVSSSDREGLRENVEQIYPGYVIVQKTELLSKEELIEIVEGQILTKD